MNVRETPDCDTGGTGPIRPGRGESLSSLHRWAATGEITHVAGGVFLPTDMLPRMPRRVESLAVVVPPQAVVAGVTAAWVWGGPPAGTIEVLIPPGVSRRMPRCVVARQDTRLLPEHVHRFTVPALAVTTPARTALDLISSSDDASADALAWLRRTLVDDDEIVSLLASRRRYPGARELRGRVRSALAQSPSR